MKHQFIVDGNIVSPVSIPEGFLADTLEPKVYVVKASQSGYFLQIKSNLFDLPSRLYGTVDSRSDKIINTYSHRTKSTGALFVGDKGAGKSLISKAVCNKAITQLQLPVLVIEEPYSGSAFNSFIESLGNVVLFFDEFGKMFDRVDRDDTLGDPQSSLLSLMDGHVRGKYLFIITENDEYKINEFMRDRPGRLYYKYSYHKLEVEAIIDYCSDYNIPEDIVTSIVDHSQTVRQFSFDMLAAIVEEYLLYNDPVSTIVSTLNISRPTSHETEKLIIEKCVHKASNTVVKVQEVIENFNTSSSHEISLIDSSSSFVIHRRNIRKKDDTTVVYDTSEYILIGTIESSGLYNYESYL